MKTYNFNIFVLLFITFFFSCSSGGDDLEAPKETKNKLTISTSIQTRAVTTTFQANDKMNLFLKSSNSVEGIDYKTGISAAYNGSAWQITPEVNIQSDVYVFAAYPYTTSVNAATIPVSVTSQVDYLYSGIGIKVSSSSPNASLTMRHALPMIAFNIAKGNYTEKGELTSVKISGEELFQTGTMNVANGQITGKEKGNYVINKAQTIESEGWKEDFPQMFCLPFNAEENKVTLTFTIDGKEFETFLPKQSIVSGMKYLFRLVLTQKGIIALGNETQIISLNKDTDDMPNTQISEIGILYNGEKACLPELKGSTSISGTVFWGDGNQAVYKYPFSYTYNDEGQHQALIQSCGTTQVKFTDLELIEEIDLSKF